MSAQIYAFDSFRVDLANRALLCREQLIPLTPKAFQTLVVLIQSRDRIVDKAELLKAVWPDTYTEESNLAHQILAIRKALGTFHDGKQYIETIAGRGYRFVGEANIVDDAMPNPQTANSPALPLASSSIPQPIGDITIAPPPMRHFSKKTTAALLAASAVLAVLAFWKSSLFPFHQQHASPVSQLRAEAEKNYLEGRFFWEKRTTSGYRVAIAHFEEAVRLDPGYAQSYAGLADAYILLGSFGEEPLGEVIPKARAAALRAIELDEHCAEAHASMGYIASRFDWNWEEAEREFKRAIEIDPRYATAHQWYSLHLITMGKTAEAIVQIKQAQSLAPASLIMTTDTALVLFYARQYDEAVKECKRALQMDASFGLAHRTLGSVYLAQGKYREALAEFDSATRSLGPDPWMLAEIGRSYALLGKRQEALIKLGALQQLAGRRFVSPSAFALLSAALDQRDDSFGWLEKEFDRHSNLAMMTVHPGFDSLRRDPRFQDLLRRIGLPQS